MKSKTARIMIHLAGIIAYLTLPVFFMPLNEPVSSLFLTAYGRADMITYVLILCYFYVNSYVLIPSLYFEKRYVLFALTSLLFLLAITTIPALVHMGPPENRPPPQGPHLMPRPAMDFLFNLQHKFLLFLMAFFFSLVLRIGNRWKQAERERITAELSHLKAQVNPHFLFNTLNSIYSLALEKSDDTADAVVRLSGMMRYVISEADKDFVSLEKEIRYVCDYVDLQKLRFGNAVHLDFSVIGDMSGKIIAPLILIPFIENAFKHGVNPEEDSDILIHIKMKDGRLEMTVKNKILPSMQQEEDRDSLGVKNTRNRLNHLYPSNHVLDIRETENEFLVVLNIGLL